MPTTKELQFFNKSPHRRADALAPKVTTRTFAYDLNNEGDCHVMINADR